MSYTVNDFFCGCGGMGLGFKQAGYETVGAWDFDDHAIMSYKHNVDLIVKKADITQMKSIDIPTAHVWAFGFPCQDLSNDGKKKGLFDGEKSKLFFEIMRLLDETPESKRPPIIMAENVRRLSKYLDTLEHEYDKVGYNTYYTLYNSRDFGVAQNRRRYYVIGIRKDIDHGFTFPEPKPEKLQVLYDILEPFVSDKYYLSSLPDTSMWTIDGHIKMEQATKLGYVIAEEGDGLDISRPGSSSRRGRLGKGIVQTLTTSGTCHITIDPGTKRARYFTPFEFGKLQGFPMDEWEQVVSDTQAYKQFGNAVSVPVAKALAEAIIKQVLEVTNGD